MKKNQINTKKQRMYKWYKSLNEFIKIQIIYKYNYEKLCFKRKKINDNKVIIKITISIYSIPFIILFINFPLINMKI